MLPDVNENFLRYVAPARRETGRLLLLGAVMFLVLVYALGMFLWLGVVAFVLAGGDLARIDLGFAEASARIAAPRDPATMVMLLTSFFGMLAAVALTVRLFHRRPVSSLFGPRPAREILPPTLSVVLPILALVIVLGLVFGDPRPNLAPATWLAWLPLALPLLFIQVSAEEMIFRGYLMQELAARYRARWIWFVLPQLVFGALHYEPATHGSNAWLVVVSTTLFGLVAADVTVRTGSLWPAIALHLANNFMAMMVLALDGTMTGLALFVTGVHASDAATVRTYLLADTGFLALAWLAWMWIASRRARLHSGASRPK